MMRILRPVSCMLLVVACGDGNKLTPDAAVVDAAADAPDNDIDAAVDAPPDAPPPGAASRVWAVGDWLTDNRREAGAFASDATLPFSTATPPPIVVPGGAVPELFDGTGATANVFDARGTKIAFVADLTVDDRFDLYVANADGTSPTLLVTGQTGIEITSVALSPDGSKVGFLMDGPVDNGFDLHVVATAGGAPVKLSPDRPVGSLNQDLQDVFFQFEWSADSKFIAFSADLTENGFDQGYVVDTTAATPVAVELLTRAEIATQATGAQGIRGRLPLDSANNIYFRARITAGSSQFVLFKSDPAGVKTQVALPARGDASAPDIGAFGITPDGTKLVFSADAPTLGTFNLFQQAVTNPQAAVNLTNLASQAPVIIRADFTTPLFFSPDSTKVATVSNFSATVAAPTRMEPHVVNLDASGTRRLFTVAAACGACDTEALAWTSDGATLFMTGDVLTNNETRVFRLDPAMTDQTPAAATDVPTGGDVLNLFVIAP